MSSIRNRVLIALVIAGILPVVIILVITWTLTSRAVRLSNFEQTSDLTNEVAKKVSSYLAHAENDLKNLATNPIIIAKETKYGLSEKKGEFQRAIENYSQFIDIVLLDRGGDLLVSKRDNNPGYKDGTNYFLDALAGKWSVAPPAIPDNLADPNNPHLEIEFYIPVVEEVDDPTQAVPLYVLKARLNFDGIWDALDEARLGDSGHFLLLDKLNNILYSQDRSLIYTKFEETIPIAEWKKRPQGDFLEEIYVANPIPTVIEGHQWTLIGFKSKRESSQLIWATMNHVLLAGSITILAAVLLGLWVSSIISKPVTQLSSATRLIAKGDLNASLPLEGPEEMANLSRDFNHMVEELRLHRDKLESLVAKRTRSLRESQEKLSDLTAQLRASYDSTQEAILVVKMDGEVLAANRRFCEMFGLQSSDYLDGAIVEERLQECFSDTRGFLTHWVRCNDSLSLVEEEEWEITSPKELVVSVYSAPVRNMSGSTFARLWMFRDLTAQRHLELGLRQAQKMEAIGRLAGGVAHDFNNLLTGIIGNLALVEMEKQDPVPGQLDKLIASAKGAGQRAAELVKQLLGFSRQSHLKLQHCIVNDIAVEVRDLLVHTIDPSIQIRLDLEEDLWGITADPNQIQQVLMNMTVNAKDAIGENGRISIYSRNLSIDSFHASLVNDAEPGDYVRISVEDTGSGMSPEVKSKIFEPFFTTKEQGKGTGLGLATSYGIIQQHGGWIACDSEIGTGTTFHIYLPRATNVVTAEQEEVLEPLRGGDETILIVDDELVVRMVGQGVLKHHGYNVITAEDGEVALDRIDEYGDKIAAVMLDLTMPKLSGKATFGMMRKGAHPDIPVVVCSGYMVDLDQLQEETG